MDLDTVSGTNNQQGEVNIFENAVALSVERKRLGTRRKLPSGAVQTDADAEMVHVAKDILESPRYEEIKTLDGDISNYIAANSVPGKTLFRAGVVLVKLERVPTIVAALEMFAERRRNLVDAFMADYPSAVGRAQAKLGSLFDREDYPPAEKVRAAFGMKWKFLEFATPRSLRTISGDIYQREVEKAQRDVQRATKEIEALLIGETQKLTEHLIERLTLKADGSKKTFRDTLVTNVKEFIQTFNPRNITDSRQLAALVEKMGKALDGVDPETLRDDDIARDRVRANFETIKTSLDAMMTDVTRKFTFTED